MDDTIAVTRKDREKELVQILANAGNALTRLAEVRFETLNDFGYQEYLRIVAHHQNQITQIMRKIMFLRNTVEGSPTPPQAS